VRKSDKSSVLQQLMAIYTSQKITGSLSEVCLAKRERLSSPLGLLTRGPLTASLSVARCVSLSEISRVLLAAAS
ncbi:hypothetical protein A2U01_0051916, partial [Trifolium medium]|nr:hypothetical protein [Trifolium medium]